MDIGFQQWLRAKAKKNHHIDIEILFLLELCTYNNAFY